MCRTNIIVNIQVEGLHNWPAARKVLPAVGFLSDPHRHIFHIECKKRVAHDDRDVEIIMFKREIRAYLTATYRTNVLMSLCDFGSKSCEMLARELLTEFDLEYCKVLEDNENGAEVYAVR